MTLTHLCCWLLAANSVGAGVVKNPWHCGLCKFRCSTRSEVLEHTWGVHGLKSQFKCGLCSYRSSSKASFDAHFGSKHPASGTVELIHVYFKVCNPVCKLKTVSDFSWYVYGTSYIYWTSELGRLSSQYNTNLIQSSERGISFLKMFWKFILLRLHFTRSNYR